MPSRKLALSFLKDSPAAIKAAVLKYREEKSNEARQHIVEAMAESIGNNVQIIVPYQDNSDYCVLEHGGKRYLEITTRKYDMQSSNCRLEEMKQ